jgi:hypothetical protein
MIRAIIVSSEQGEVNGASRRVRSLETYLQENGIEVHHYVARPSRGPRIVRFLSPRRIIEIRHQIAFRNASFAIFCGIEFCVASRFSPTKKSAIDVCDSQSMLLESQDFRSNRFLAQQAKRLATWLMFTLVPKKVDLTYITEIDRVADIAYNTRNKTSHFGNLPDGRLRSVSNVGLDVTSIGFVADFSYAPNSAGLTWFLTRVFPFLSNGVRLNLYGPKDPLIDNDQVKFLGFVPDIRTIYSSNAIFIAPDFGGAGQKNKVIEALVAGRPIISSTRGSAGLENVSGLVVSDDPKVWISELNSIRSRTKGNKPMGDSPKSRMIHDVLNEGRLNFREWMKEILND